MKYYKLKIYIYLFKKNYLNYNFEFMHKKYFFKVLESILKFLNLIEENYFKMNSTNQFRKNIQLNSNFFHNRNANNTFSQLHNKYTNISNISKKGFKNHKTNIHNVIIFTIHNNIFTTQTSQYNIHNFSEYLMCFT